jgi:hypothetical protein
VIFAFPTVIDCEVSCPDVEAVKLVDSTKKTAAERESL